MGCAAAGGSCTTSSGVEGAGSGSGSDCGFFDSGSGVGHVEVGSSTIGAGVASDSGVVGTVIVVELEGVVSSTRSSTFTLGTGGSEVVEAEDDVTARPLGVRKRCARAPPPPPLPLPPIGG
jgi:hypothetical protein